VIQKELEKKSILIDTEMHFEILTAIHDKDNALQIRNMKNYF
jgi:hypothetical protein